MKIVCLNGRYLSARDAKISAFDAGFLYGEGIYETLRTVDGKLMNVSGHLKRLQHSAEVVGIKLPPLKKVERWLNETVKRNNLWKSGKESRVRLTVTGGVHGYAEVSQKPTILITVEPLAEVSRQVRTKGVSVITMPLERPFPEAKTTFLIPAMKAERAMKKARAYEVLLLDRKGRVTEGSISNLFLVKGGRLVTPKSWILGGTTRERIIGLARKHRWKCVQKDFKLRTLYSADEIFICNAPRGVVPVVKVDGRTIGDGRVGDMTRCVWEKLKEGA